MIIVDTKTGKVYRGKSNIFNSALMMIITEHKEIFEELSKPKEKVAGK